MMTKRILIVDDHPIVAEGLQALLCNDVALDVVGHAGDAQSAMDAIEALSPDVVLLDISLPGRSGISVIRDIKARWRSLPVVIFTLHDTLDYAERALSAGAIGYLTKDETTEAIKAAIGSACQGKVFLSREIREAFMQHLAYHADPVENSSVDLLSNRELEVFEAIGKGFETGEVAELLHISPRTVESHRRNVKDKLGIDGLTELVRRAALWVEEQQRPHDPTHTVGTNGAATNGTE